MTIASSSSTSVEKLSFAITGSLELNANQFSSTGISTSALLEGAAAVQFIDITMTVGGSFSAIGFTFANWTDGVDYIVLRGSSSNNTITGSTRNDSIIGGSANDTVTGRRRLRHASRLFR